MSNALKRLMDLMPKTPEFVGVITSSNHPFQASFMLKFRIFIMHIHQSNACKISLSIVSL